LVVGRELEQRRLDALLDAARAGRSGVLVVRGVAGAGKTTLMEYAAEHAGGMRMLRARGVEAETGLAFAALDQLLHPVLELLDELPGRQAAALRSALALSDAAESDRFAVYVARLMLLAAAAEARPLLALVDDAHWLDRSSAEALRFAGRRLEAEGVALVFAARDREPDEFAAPGFEELHVDGLDVEAAATVLHRRGARLSRAVVARITAETGGNPLALIELGELLTAQQLAGEQPLPEPLAAGEAAQRGFLRRAQLLSAGAQAALVVAASAGEAELGPLLAALDSIGVGRHALNDVEAAGLIDLRGGRVVFEHPLLRSAVYGAADPSERRSAHRALADALASQAPDRRAWHLAKAALGPDEDVAAALERAAEAARRRTGYAAAAEALERAAQFTPPGGPRVQQLIAGADMARHAGRVKLALRLLDSAAAEEPDVRLVVEITHARGRLDWMRGQARRAVREYAEAAAMVEHTNAGVAVLAWLEASMAARDAGDIPRAVEAAQRAEALAGAGEDLLAAAARALVGVACYWSGESGEAHARLSHAIAASDRQQLADLGAGSLADLSAESLIYLTAWRVWTGVNVERGRAPLEGLLDTTRDAGALGLLAFALAVYGQLLLRDGQWETAYATAAEAAVIAAEVGAAPQQQYLLGALALMEAAQGRERACRAHAEEALAITRATELATPATVHEALGLLELGAGRAEQALAHLETATIAGGSGDKRLARPSLGDLVEAHVRSGRSVPATLTAALSRAGEGDFDGSQAVMHRCLGLLAGEDAFDAHFSRALELHGEVWPFARARTELGYGERLRRAGRRIDARTQLHAALATFETVGASPWAERARRELRATGERIARRDPTTAEQLTPQELQIALLVARGASNRETAAAVFLGPKTVEHHLSQIYRKLGLRSRSELARTLHDVAGTD